jgi:hypothetical protein
MSFIDLDSVGSVVDEFGSVFPQDISEPPVTASDADEMLGVSIFETTDEWIENLSSEDIISLISFLDEHIGYDVDNPSQILYSYEEWRTNVWSHWEDVNNEYMNLEVI